MDTPLGKQREAAVVCHACQTQIDTIAALSLFAEEELALLREPRRTIRVTFPLVRDNGTIVRIEGFRVQYNDALGPTKGGIRVHEDAHCEEVTELAFLMSLKTSLVGLPYGGAKGSIRINPKHYSRGELERIYRGYVREIARSIGEDMDIPAPDVNTNAEVMAIMCDEYQRVTGSTSRAVFTGKPFAIGGSLGRETSTSRGGFYIIEERFKHLHPDTVRVAIQGFGNVGMHLAELLHEKGFSIVAVSDSAASLYKSDGLSIPDLVRWKKDGRSFSDWPHDKLPDSDLLTLDVDLLIPAALGNVITSKNAQEIRARVVVEMANAPIDPAVESMLRERQIEIIPDILANSGGVIVSYFEWLQNKKGEQWTIAKVEQKLRDTILPAYKEVLDEQNATIDLRRACYIKAIRRILEAERKRLRT